MPILETARLCLRPLTLEDTDALHAVLGDPIAMVHYPKPYDREMTVGWIEWNLRNYAKYGFGLWAVILKEDGRLIGDCGITVQQVDGVPREEIGYHILRELWGRGYATEAAAGVRDYGFGVLGLKQLISWMGVDNRASRRVAERIGMTLEKQTVNRFGGAQVVYSIAPAVPRG
ncbi:MAG: GNAT family N-acetyltransferase [Planctomycetes bacterium]|nr:GNAT family N-acetyltransferase [Planctomycetota bacterium]